MASRSPDNDPSPRRAAADGDRPEQDRLATTPDTLLEDGVGLYVHLPFCVSKCRYCDFNSYAWNGQDLERHVESVLTEARRRVLDLRPQTVFIGGGTPSYLDPPLLAHLLDELHEASGFRDSAQEVTIEANPESLDDETAAAALEHGVDRVSIGVQSLRRDVLAAYDRVHSPEEALAAFRRARDAGFERVNVDLIFAFPGQDPDAWREDLATALALEPEHVSCYELSYEPGTALTRLRDAGRWNAEDPDVCRRLFDDTRAQCLDAGFGRYEVSNFARAGEACRHNLGYWRGLDYVGIGAGAASWRDGERRSNLSLPEDYEAALARDADPIGERERPDARTRLFDHLLMGLRLSDEGVSLARARRISGSDPLDVHGAAFEAWTERGWIEHFEHARHGASVRATEEGLTFLDSMLQEMLPATPV